jgi:hypothetical protein
LALFGDMRTLQHNQTLVMRIVLETDQHTHQKEDQKAQADEGEQDHMIRLRRRRWGNLRS